LPDNLVFGISLNIAARDWQLAKFKGFFADPFDFLGVDFGTKASLGMFPPLAENCDSFTITFWIKPIVPEKVSPARLYLCP
jgi:hypothetical protein